MENRLNSLGDNQASKATYRTKIKMSLVILFNFLVHSKNPANTPKVQELKNLRKLKTKKILKSVFNKTQGKILLIIIRCFIKYENIFKF